MPKCALGVAVLFVMRKMMISMMAAIFLVQAFVPTVWAQAGMGALDSGTGLVAAGAFAPVMIRGIALHPENAMKMDFIIDPGEAGGTIENVAAQGNEQIKYFMAGLTVPARDLWVNLSPYERGRIIPSSLVNTALGREMLTQDQILKQVAASLGDPRTALGQRFWDRVYKESREKFGAVDLPFEGMSKVWIMPGKAEVLQHGGKAYIVQSRLKVMLDEDHARAYPARDASYPSAADMSRQVMREILLPALEEEVNTGRQFARIRQIYHALVLAYWFKQNFQKSILNRIYAGRGMVKGIDIHDRGMVARIYSRYVESFRQGAYDVVAESSDPMTGDVVPRRYFSGGEMFNDASMASAVSTVTDEMLANDPSFDGQQNVLMTVEFHPVDLAMADGNDHGEWGPNVEWQQRDSRKLSPEQVGAIFNINRQKQHWDALKGRIWGFNFKSLFDQGLEYRLLSLVSTSRKIRKAMTQKIMGVFEPWKKVVSVGEGQGHLARSLMQAGLKDIEAVDLSPENVKRARSRGVKAQEGNAYALTYLPNSVDGMIFNECIGTMDPFKGFGEAHRVLRPGGRVVVTTYDLAGPDFQIQDSRRSHYIHFKPEFLERAMKDAGFVSVVIDDLQVKDTKYFFITADKAMAPVPINGGIDLVGMAVDIKSEGADLPLPESMRRMDLNSLQGFVPVILDVRSLGDVVGYIRQ